MQAGPGRVGRRASAPTDFACGRRNVQRNNIHDGPDPTMVILRYTTNGLTFRRAFHDDSWKVKLRTLLEAGIEVSVEEMGLTRSWRNAGPEPRRAIRRG